MSTVTTRSIVRNGRVLDSRSLTLIDADVLIEGDTIAAVGPHLEAPPDAEPIDANARIVIPGLVNCHTHAHNNVLRGVADNWTLEDARNFGPAVFALRTPEEHYVSAAIGAVEMLKTGCTAAYDMFTAMPMLSEEGVEAVIRAYTDVGMRAVLAPQGGDMVFYGAVPGLLDLLPDDLRKTVDSLRPAPTQGMLEVFRNAILRWNGTADGRIHMAVAPVVPGECSDAFLDGCVSFVREFGVGVQTHLAETKMQAMYGIERWGRPLAQHLADIGMVGPRFVGGHGVWLTDDEIAILGDTGSSVAHNPASNLKLGSGIAPVRELLDQGVTVGLGADGSMSSDNQNMFEAMRFAGLVNKVRFAHDPDRWIGARGVWRMATTEAARVLGLCGRIGAVEPGYKADLVLMRADSTFLRPINDIVNTLVYSETGADVDTVLVGGRRVVEGGRVLGVDEKDLCHRAQAAAERVRGSNVEAFALSERLLPFVRAACRTCAATAFPINRYATPTLDRP